MSVTAILPLRLDSQRLSYKITYKIWGQTLHEIAIANLYALIKSGVVDTAAIYASEYVWERLQCTKRDLAWIMETEPAKYMTLDGCRIALETYPDSDVVCVVYCTSPFIERRSLAACIRAVRTGGYDCATTVRKCNARIWRNGQQITTDANRTQDREPAYICTNAIWVASRELVESGTVISDNIFLRPVTPLEAIDIDEQTDYDLANRVNVL